MRLIIDGTWDTLNMMAFYDAAVISIMLVSFLLTIVKMNEETQHAHLQILEGQRLSFSCTPIHAPIDVKWLTLANNHE
jgi:hypothetical protein